MIKTLVFILSLAAFSCTGAIDNSQAEKIADAIKKVENSVKYPYGIKSIKIKGNTQTEREAYARKICINTIKNNYIRWEKAGKPNDFISFLGSRYAPIGAPDDPRNLNSNWVKNLKAILHKK